jgi:hypothetical protein
MLPTIAASPQRTKLGLSVGAPLTADVAEEMTSPLDRLQRGMEGRAEGTEWRSGDSLLGVADVAKGKVEADSDDEPVDLATEMKKAASEPRPRRRRSRSTGDVNVAETVSVSSLPSIGIRGSCSSDIIVPLSLGAYGSHAHNARTRIPEESYRRCFRFQRS